MQGFPKQQINVVLPEKQSIAGNLSRQLWVGSTPSQWLSTVVSTYSWSLSAQKVLPIEKVTNLKDYLETHQIKTIYQDGVEREVPRSTDYQTQKEYYSGKKKQHNVKNNVMTSDTAEVLFVSPTYEGKVHDKKIND